MHTLLLTRIQADCEALSARLNALGFNCIDSPMLEIHPAPGWQAQIEPGARGIIFTSRHTIRVAADREELKQLPVYVVGEQTAAAARAAGFHEPVYTAPTAHDLTRHFLNAHYPPTHLLYLSGEHIKRNFSAELIVENIHVQRVVAYHAKAAKKLSDEAVRALKSHRVNGVLFYSSRTAEIFLKTLRTAGLDADVTEDIPAFCISESVADTCHKLGYAGPLLVISKPDSPAMIARLKSHFLV